jgi:exosortase
MNQKINNTLSGQKIKAVILAGGRDFGRCPLTSNLPTALWPVAGRPALKRLLEHLVNQGINDIVIFSGQNKSILTEYLQIDKRIHIEYLDEPLPVGTAGSIREAVKSGDDSLLILFPSSLTYLPDIEALIDEHIEQKSDLTVVLEPAPKNINRDAERASGIYICNTSVLEFIPEEGYYDIKEGLIPKMLRAGKNVHAAALSQWAGSFRDCHEYLQAISNNIKNIAEMDDLKPCETYESKTLWTGRGVEIDPTARISGYVILLDNVKISEDAVIIGPALLEKNVTIGRGSIIVNSVLWENTNISENCNIDQCVLSYNTNLYPLTSIVEQCVVSEENIIRKSNNLFSRKIEKVRIVSNRIQANSSYLCYKKFNADINQAIKYINPVLITIVFFWSYWPGISNLWGIWMRSDEYSSGLLVPFLALYILWIRRHSLLQVPIKPSVFGLFLFLAAQAMRIFGLFYLFSSAERLSLVLSIVALVLLLFGWKLFFKISSILLFLVLMLPWPQRIQTAISLPLQSISTSSAVFCLELTGFDIIREGNVIHIGNATVAVAEACNGLRMITAFFVISGLVALLVNRTWWEKLIVLLSSLPIAFLCNTLRLTVTAIAFTVIEGPDWEKIFHDFGGYAMMPLALAFIVAELWLIDKLTIIPEEKKEVIITRQKH